MPSRKRNKGKERKAKKVAEVNSMWVKWARGESKDKLGTYDIFNEMTLAIPDGSDKNDPVVRFMDTLSMNWIDKNVGLPLCHVSNMRITYEKHRPVWNNENYRGMVRDILAAIGINFLLRRDYPISASFAWAVAFLDHYDEDGDFDSSAFCRQVATKFRDLFMIENSRMRELLKFYRKRVACSYLKKEIHIEARKNLGKMGFCSNCRQTKERAMLMVCGRCRINQYCSKACQVTQWPKHKCICDMYVRVHKAHQAKSSGNDDKM